MVSAFEVTGTVSGNSGSSRGTFATRAVALLAALLLGTGCIPSSDNPGVPGEAANLSALELTDSAQQKIGLSPSFSGNTTGYTADVGGAVSSLTIKATVPSPGNTTIRLQQGNDPPSTQVSGQPSNPITLNAGANSITITVDAPGATKAYLITVNRGANANLQTLQLSAGGLSPAFAPATTNYTATTGFGTQSTTVTATLADSTARFTVNGAAGTSGQPSAPIQLSTGATTISIVVTATNGTTRAYTVVVSRAGTSDLADLKVSGTSVPSFDPGQTSYAVSVPSSASTVGITPVAADSSASITINGQSVNSGQTFPALLNIGANPFSIVVTGPGVPAKTYSLTITRAQASANNSLSNLTVNPPGGTVPGFSPNNSGPYTVNVGSGVTSVTVAGALADGSARMEINNQPAESGQGISVQLSAPPPSSTPINVTVVAENGNARTYTVLVNRAAAASGNANLQSLALPPASISFNQATLTYNTSVANSVGAVTVNAVVADPSATMRINGQQVASPSNLNVPLNVGNNTINIQVTAPAGNSQTYQVNVTRGAAASSDATLSNLVVTPPGGTVPNFSGSNSGPYTVTVPFGTSSATVTVTRSNGNAAVFMDGVQGTSRIYNSLPVTATILVIAQDTVTNKSYTVNINVAAGSSNASLSSLTVTPGGTCNLSSLPCNVTIPNATTSVNIAATKADASANMTGAVTAPPGTPGGQNSLPTNGTGPFPFTITVTAQAGNSQSYQINVTKQAAIGNNNLQSLAVSPLVAPGLSPAFSPSVTAYSGNVLSATSGVTVTAAPQDSAATVSITPTPVMGVVPLALAGQKTEIAIVVTVANATPKTYSVTITRP